MIRCRCGAWPCADEKAHAAFYRALWFIMMRRFSRRSLFGFGGPW